MKDKTYIGQVDGIAFRVRAGKKPGKETTEALQAMVKLVYHKKMKTKNDIIKSVAHPSELPEIDYENGSIQVATAKKAMDEFASQKIQKIIPTDEELATEIIARFSGNSRGNPISKNAFIDAVNWIKQRVETAKTE